jgi:hypothetical protein
LRALWVMMLLAALGGKAQARGAGIFIEHCAVCHQPNGRGVPGLYPPLANSLGNYVRTAEGRAYLVDVLSFGLSGPIAAHGQSYNGTMQPWPQFSNKQIAQVLNYVLTRFNGDLLPKEFRPFTGKEVARIRRTKRSIADVYKERQSLTKDLSGQATGEPGRPRS